jgi:xylan 1,4-beta-xylosidase
VRINITGLPAGTYQLNIYHVGYHANDVYGDYLDLGAPQTLTREQVRALGEKNDGAPSAKSTVHVNRGKAFSRDIQMRENDVYSITLEATAAHGMNERKE